MNVLRTMNIARYFSRSDATGSQKFEIACYLIAVAAFTLLLQGATYGSQAFAILLVLLAVAMPMVGLWLDPRRRAVAQREFVSFFYTPVGYVVLSVFAAITGLFFFLLTDLFQPGSAIETDRLFRPMAWGILIPITPAITMRLFAEELRSGNLEALTTAPITDAQLVLGKWLGAFSFLCVAVGLSLILILLLEIHGDPDYGPIFTGYVGILLLGGLFLAIGTLASTLTHNQIIAFLTTLIVIALLTYINFIVTNKYLSGRIALWMNYLNPNEHSYKFSLGMLDSSDFVFFLSTIALFLVLAVKSLESRKWR